MTEFVHLHNHSHNGSILDGFGSIQEYAEAALKNKQRGFGITDHGTEHALYKFLGLTRDAGLLGVPGCEFYMAPINPEGSKRLESVFYGPTNNDGKPLSKNDVSSSGAYLHLTVWAYNNTGLYNLFKLSTLSYDPDRYYYKPRIDFDLLVDHSDGLIISTGCPSSEISTRFLLGQDDKAFEYANRLKEVFGDRLFVEIMDHNMSIDLERKLLPKQLLLSKKMNIPLLATNDCHYAHKNDSLGHEQLLCIQSKSTMDEKTYNDGGKRFAFNGNGYYMKSSEEMAKMFPPEDFPGALENTVEIAEMSSDIKIEYNPHLRPKPVIPPEFNNEVDYYKHLIQKGYQERYGNAPIEIKQEAKKRNRQEFEVIHSSDFIGYMLVVRDYLAWTKDKYSTRDSNGDIMAYSIGPGRGCFLPNNQVTINNNDKISIKELYDKFNQGSVNNVKVLTHDGTYQKLDNAFKYSIDEEIVELTLNNNQKISSTKDHRIFVKNRGFVSADDIKIGDTVIGPDNKKDTVSSKGTTFLDDDTVQGTFISEKTQKKIKYVNNIELKILNILETDTLVKDFDKDPITHSFIIEDFFNNYSVLVNKFSVDKKIDHFIYKNDVIPVIEYDEKILEYDDMTHKEFEVVGKNIFSYIGDVYDLHIDKAKNYVVSDVTVHNSVGGSIHAYELGISELDPIKYGLIFERFLSAGRGATYEVVYDDGTREEIIVSDKKIVLDENGKKQEKYIHQLNVGDIILEEDDT